MKKAVNIILSVVFALAVIIATLSFSIGLPIYNRAFFYHQVEPLELSERSGKTDKEIKEAYDELLDYLTLPNKEFGTGAFKFSDEGKTHFEDCKALFNLNLSAFIISAVLIPLLLFLNKTRKIRLAKVGGYGIGFISGLITLSLCFMAIPIAPNFENAFDIFHRMFFGNNESWMLSAKKDAIIRIFPPEFFMNCAILIGASVGVISLLLIISSIIKKNSRQ